MTALDTNLVVRLLTNDDPRQASRVAALVDQDTIFLPKTVLLESEWVLRYAYNLERPVIHAALLKLLGLATLTVEDSETVLQALAWYGEGLDLADALHLASSRSADAFATFDRKLRNRAKRLNDAAAVVEP